MDNTILSVLSAKNCPYDLHGLIWGCIPHNDKPLISLAEIQKQCTEIKARKIVLSVNLNSSRLTKFMNFAVNFTNAINIIKEMTYDRELRETMKNNDIILMGPFVRLRSAIEINY